MEAAARRRYTRVATDRSIRIRRVDSITGTPAALYSEATVKNLSAGGALLAVDEPHWRNARLQLRIAWSSPRLFLLLTARVVRVFRDDERIGIAIEFLDTTPEQSTVIVSWILQEAKRTNQLSDPIRPGAEPLHAGRRMPQSRAAQP